MPKYYVQSGQIKTIIDRKDHKTAILDVLKDHKGKGMLTVEKICLSETGWTSDLDCYDIDPFLRKTQ
jgi:hypothetical protein